MSDALTDLLEQVYRRTSGAVRPGLDTITELLVRLGNPHQQLAVLHVAGTNGKGSVCAMLESMLAHSGLPVGLYTSPHLVRVNERFRISGRQIDDETLFDLLTRILKTDDVRCSETGHRAATFFELTTALAYLFFYEQDVKLTVIETGMGGRWDATNVVVPVLSIITNIEIDHTQYLGNSLESIADEKSGIIKPGRPVVVGKLRPQASSIVQRKAVEQKARLIQATEAVSIARLEQNDLEQIILVESCRHSYGRVHLPLLGDHQLENCAIAVAVYEEAAEIIGLNDERAVPRGLQCTSWHGRLEQIGNDPVLLVDGAHNESGAKNLVAEIRRRYHRRHIGLICGILADKDIEGMVRQLAVLHGRCWTVPVNSDRTADASELAARFREHKMAAESSDLETAMKEASDWARDNGGIVLAAGSLFLVGEVMKMVGMK